MNVDVIRLDSQKPASTAVGANCNSRKWLLMMLPDTATWEKMKPADRYSVLKNVSWPEDETVLTMLKPAEKNVILKHRGASERQAILDKMRPSERNAILGSSKPLWVHDPYRSWGEWGCIWAFTLPLAFLALFGVGLLAMHPVGWAFIIGGLITLLAKSDFGSSIGDSISGKRVLVITVVAIVVFFAILFGVAAFS